MPRLPYLVALTVLLCACAAPPPAATEPTPPAQLATEAPVPATPLSEPTAAPPTSVLPTPEPATLAITSVAFAEGGAIPVEHTCDGANASPALAWDAPPAGTQSLALIVEDPDAGDYTHWVLFNIPPDVRALPAAVPPGEGIDAIGLQAQNSFAQPGYNGPCPPPGATHRYVFTLYALSEPLPLQPDPISPVSKGMVRDAFDGRILGEGRLTGTYTRP